MQTTDNKDILNLICNRQKFIKSIYKRKSAKKYIMMYNIKPFKNKASFPE
jgi:hypothetical protein